MKRGTNDIKWIMSSLLRSLKYSLVLALVLGIIGGIIAIVRGNPFITGVYLTYYIAGVLALVVSIPQLYKRDEDSKVRRVRLLSPLYGFNNVFNNPYAESEMIKSFDEFRGEGFWTGINIVVYALSLWFYGFIVENIYFTYFRG